ncbi:putative phosphopantetheinyl transferase [Pseudomonas fluorescens]|uniref:Enterobactin synthase component D n=1 Tax=Pseudomonas fluorescens TaxID=294 RepID=A0A379IHH2_PSEFL|nr:4'-phosphopantetheinyl transferase superfamily protein [Pseudomonas fluorescens]AIG02347.1 4'-phosphopantetheinyl transferase [Pseudomonas fluorescens]SUD32812.1 putative phosphopantetheinyl transferase [Pseudomonas fluorescens]
MNPIPACCTPLDDHWPLPTTLPGTVFLSTRFEPKLLEAGDFQRCAVPPPASIQRSVAKRQAEFLAGRLCARSALKQLAGLDFIPAIGEDRAPVWPGHISGSITHSTGHAAAIVGHKAQWRGLGMDLENLLPLERAERLAGEILTPDEMQRMGAGSREQIAQWVTLTFSAKESLFKALYPIVQKRFYFEHAEVVQWSEAGSLRLRLLTDLSSEWRHGKELEGQFAVQEGQLLSLVAISA